MAEITEQRMPALVNHQIDVVYKQILPAIGEGIEQKRSIKNRPANESSGGNRFPRLTEGLGEVVKAFRNHSTYFRHTRFEIPHKISYGMVCACDARSLAVMPLLPLAPMRITSSPASAGIPVTSIMVISMVTVPTMVVMSPRTITRLREDKWRISQSAYPTGRTAIRAGACVT